jgi:diazepam-binding inhibitor (GABA receptor modulating acyl-CoA-binding protein)
MDFDTAVGLVKELKEPPTIEEKLKLYGLYKQYTIGDINIKKPFLLDFEGNKKWNAWDSNEGMEQETAQKEYINLVKELIEKYKLKDE